MPNTPCLVGEAACGFALGSLATPADRALVTSLLDAVGVAVEVPEPLLDAVTGLSGSGPAYVFQVSGRMFPDRKCQVVCVPSITSCFCVSSSSRR